MGKARLFGDESKTMCAGPLHDVIPRLQTGLPGVLEMFGCSIVSGLNIYASSRPRRRLMTHGDFIFNPRNSRGFPGDCLSGFLHEAFTDFTGQIHDVIQCLYMD
jgi:hypothetical protein